MNLHGFTIVEMLVVMTVLITVGTIILSIFVISLQGTLNTNSQQIARESGQFALTQITRQIKFAKEFNGVTNDPAGGYKLACSPRDEDNDAQEYSHIQITGFDSGITTYSCNEQVNSQGKSSYQLASNSALLLKSTKQKVTKCQFTCYQDDPYDPPTIGISFEIQYNESKPPLPFQTTVIPRNY